MAMVSVGLRRTVERSMGREGVLGTAREDTTVLAATVEGLRDVIIADPEIASLHPTTARTMATIAREIDNLATLCGNRAFADSLLVVSGYIKNFLASYDGDSIEL
jgi:hypothetical protein